MSKQLKVRFVDGPCEGECRVVDRETWVVASTPPFDFRQPCPPASYGGVSIQDHVIQYEKIFYHFGVITMFHGVRMNFMSTESDPNDAAASAILHLEKLWVAVDKPSMETIELEYP